MLGLAVFELCSSFHAMCRAMQPQSLKNVHYDFPRPLTARAKQTEQTAGSNMANIHGKKNYMRSNGANPTKIWIFPCFRVFACMVKIMKKYAEIEKWIRPLPR